MVRAAPGSFLMGSPPSSGAKGEPFLGRVTIAHRFAYSRDKVSLRDWKYCVLANQCESLGATGVATSDPVVQVSWANWNHNLPCLTLETAPGNRFPTEPNWEYLPRATRPLRPPALEGP